MAKTSDPIIGLFVNGETGESIERALTAEEIAELEAAKGTPAPLTPAE